MKLKELIAQKYTKCWIHVKIFFNSVCIVITVRQLKGKWQTLRGTYRQRRKDYHLPSDSAASQRRWVYFESLTFLEPFLAQRETSSNAPTMAIHTEVHVSDNEEDIILEVEGELQESQYEIEESQYEIENSHSENALENCDMQDEIVRSQTSTRTPSRASRSGSTNSAKRKKESSQDLEETMKVYFKSKFEKQNGQKIPSVRLFHESLEEDLAKFSEPQLRRYKLKVLTIINGILENESA